MDIKEFKKMSQSATPPPSQDQDNHALITISQIKTGFLVKSKEGWHAFPSLAEVFAHITKLVGVKK